MWSGKEFLDYDTYKSKISSIWDSIWDKIGDIWDKISSSVDGENNGNLDWGKEIDIDENEVDYDEEIENETENDQEKTAKNSGKNIIKAFPNAIRFVKIPELNVETKPENVWILSWYSRTDLLWVINRYLEKNLDDDTDVLVTVEYGEDSADPQKIILQTQSKNEHSVVNSDDLMGNVFQDSERKVPNDIEIISTENIASDAEKSSTDQKQDVHQKQIRTTKKTTSTRLTQQEQKEAEEIFWILF